MSISQEQLGSLAGLQGGLDERDLTEAIDANRTNIELLEAKMEQLEQAMVKARKEQHLLENLLALRRGEDLGAVSKVVRPRSEPVRVSASNGIADAAVSVLEEAGRPMHIGELMSALVRDGVEIPGAGTQANLIAHLRRDKRIARPSRGMYGLRALGVEEYEPKRRGARRKRSRRTRTRKKTTRS